MTRVLLLGESGMLGGAIMHAAPKDGDIEIVHWGYRFTGSIRADAIETIWPDGIDCIINTVGRRPQEKGPDTWMSYLNATVPHLVAARAVVAAIPVIHVSTDCVFSGGWLGPVRRESGVNTPNPDTLYGRTKLAGESEHAINVRTSFVGPRHGLWKWLAEQEKERPYDGIQGWTNAWWSGSTVNAVAEALLKLARDPGEARTLHLATEEPINKYTLLLQLRSRLGFEFPHIAPADEPRIDRSLAPDIILPPFDQALREMVP